VASYHVSAAQLKRMTPAQRKAALAREKASQRRPVAKTEAPVATIMANTGTTLPAAAPTGEAPASSDAAAAALPTGVVSAAPVAAGTTAGTAGPAAVNGGGFNGPVYGIATSGDTVLAITSLGLTSSTDNGQSFTLTGPERSGDWRYLAAAKANVVAASLHGLSFSADAGKSWGAVLLPEGLTQVGAVSVEPSGVIWVGGREGIFVSKNGGNDWATPKNLFVNTVNSIYYDDASSRMIVTTGSYGNFVFLVQLPSMHVSFADAGWNLRFARPMGDHLIAATLYDGIVVQPRMVATPMQGEMQKPAPASVPVLTASPVRLAVPTASAGPAATGEVLGPNGVPVVEPVHLPTSPN
jgi:hypothetical protein